MDMDPNALRIGGDRAARFCVFVGHRRLGLCPAQRANASKTCGDCSSRRREARREAVVMSDFLSNGWSLFVAAGDRARPGCCIGAADHRQPPHA